MESQADSELGSQRRHGLSGEMMRRTQECLPGDEESNRIFTARRARALELSLPRRNPRLKGEANDYVERFSGEPSPSLLDLRLQAR